MGGTCPAQWARFLAVLSGRKVKYASCRHAEQEPMAFLSLDQSPQKFPALQASAQHNGFTLCVTQSGNRASGRFADWEFLERRIRYLKGSQVRFPLKVCLQRFQNAGESPSVILFGMFPVVPYTDADCFFAIARNHRDFPRKPTIFPQGRNNLIVYGSCEALAGTRL